MSGIDGPLSKEELSKIDTSMRDWYSIEKRLRSTHAEVNRKQEAFLRQQAASLKPVPKNSQQSAVLDSANPVIQGTSNTNTEQRRRQ
jgi:hypothetical protein